MRYIIIIVFIFQSINAQQSGHIEYMYTSNFAFHHSTTSVLEFDLHKSKYILLKPNNNKQKEEKITKTIDDKGNYKINVILPDTDTRPTIIIDRSLNLLCSTKRTMKGNELLKENIPIINWNIKEEFKELNTIKCQKAIGYFRGRLYTVWFANDIPVPYGPWKLQGLPGLILEAEDNKGQVFLKATKVILEEVAHIELPDLNKAVSLKHFITVIEPKRHKERIELARARNKNRNSNIVISSHKSSSGRNIELIYEWEEGYPNNKQ